MIRTQTIRLKKPNEFDNLWIEKELSSMGLDVIRWAVIEVTDRELIVSVSHNAG